jgi:hypothetical protein
MPKQDPYEKSDEDFIEFYAIEGEGSRPADRQGKIADRKWADDDKNWPYKIRATTFGFVRVGIAVVFFIALAILIVYVLHLTLPSQYRWLKPDEAHALADILALATGGAIGAFFSKTFQKFFSDINGPPNQ